MKVLGVIGGMGPAASQLFYSMIIENTEASGDQEHLDIILVSRASMPDRTGLLLSGGREILFEKLLSDAKYLENSGAAAIAIPCNTAHALAGELQAELRIPIINMVREASAETDARFSRMHAAKPAKIAILGTDGTIRSELYQRELEKRGLAFFLPSAENQKRVMEIIYDGIKKGKETDYADFAAVEAELQLAECDSAIIACTELSCFRRTHRLSGFYIDAMEILARKSIVFCGKPLRKSKNI
ncbi:MAG: amino acid racemase [Clostridiales Family XIII bacterium]|jgi:aspartate racemase|nr:amino acid racemase [Clostridiales Family XIII bacterium]